MPHPVEPTPRRRWPDDAEELFVSDAASRRARLSAAIEYAAERALPQHAPAPSGTIEQKAKILVAPRRVRSHLRPAWVWGLIGFASGIVFWHLIGFWSFVAETVYPLAAGSQQANPQVAPTNLDRANLHARATRTRTAKSPPSSAPPAPDTWTATVSGRSGHD